MVHVRAADIRAGFDGISVISLSPINSISSGDSGERQSSSSSVASHDLDGDVGLLTSLLMRSSMTRESISTHFSFYHAVSSPTRIPRAESVTPVPRWRLAQEGPFLSELPRSDVGAFGQGYAFCNTTHKSSDFAQPSGKYGLPLHRARFLEWIGAPESARLLDKGPNTWIHSLSREQAIEAA